jgi:hypothetical protein
MKLGNIMSTPNPSGNHTNLLLKKAGKNVKIQSARKMNSGKHSNNALKHHHIVGTM